MIDILTGPVRSGKTTLLRRIVQELRNRDFRVGGFLSLSVLRGGKVSGYDLLVLTEGRSFPFLREKGGKIWERIGPFFFIPATLEKARGLILQEKDTDIFIVDEVGPLELEGKGLWPALNLVRSRPAPGLLLTVRSSALSAFREKWGKDVDGIFSISDPDVLAGLISHFEKKLRSLKDKASE